MDLCIYVCIYIYVFIYIYVYVVIPRPTLGHWQEGSLIHPMFITASTITSLTERLPGALKLGWDCWTHQWNLNRLIQGQLCVTDKDVDSLIQCYSQHYYTYSSTRNFLLPILAPDWLILIVHQKKEWKWWNTEKMSRKYMQHKQHKAVFFNVKPPHWHVM